MQREDAEQWKAAFQREYDSLIKNKTYILVPRPVGKPIVSTKWVLEVKDNGLYKARFVARGFTQVAGVNYEETYAPVVKQESLRTFVSSWAGVPNVEIHQMDACTAFMNGYLPDENHVCLLGRSLNGLKQSARVWYDDIKPTFERMGFKCCTTDNGVFILQDKETGKVIASILLYVDDLLIGSASKQTIVEIKEQMSLKYEMKDLGIAKKFIGLELVDVKDEDGNCIGLGVHMGDYVGKILAEYGMEACKSVSTPMESGLKLYEFREGQDQEADADLYRSLIGSLNYAACLGRPDITRSVNALARYSSKPSQIHLNAAKRILRYLNGTKRLGIVYSRNIPTPITLETSIRDDQQRARSIC
jgi:hypothetical protein